MPELPEVETICRTLSDKIIGKKIQSTLLSGLSLRLPLPKNLASRLEGQEIINISRRARYLLLTLSSDEKLLIHLGMTGKLLYANNQPTSLSKHDHFLLLFTSLDSLLYNDIRRFGLIDLADAAGIKNHKMLKNLGPEPLSDQFNSSYLESTLFGKKLNIKTAMMDNQIVVGVGNIYINEALFLSGISPLRPASSLNKQELKDLTDNIKKILAKAIEQGGSSLRDYVDANGNSGHFQLDFKIYGKNNVSCITCNDKVKKIRQNGRGSYYCPTCQK